LEKRLKDFRTIARGLKMKDGYIIIIIIATSINAYPEAGLWTLFPPNVYIVHTNYSKNLTNTIITL